MAKKIPFKYFPTTGELINFGPHEKKLMNIVFREGLKEILKGAKKSWRYELIIKWRNLKCKELYGRK